MKGEPQIAAKERGGRQSAVSGRPHDARASEPRLRRTSAGCAGGKEGRQERGAGAEVLKFSELSPWHK
jgi:hypothetical protein